MAGGSFPHVHPLVMTMLVSDCSNTSRRSGVRKTPKPVRLVIGNSATKKI